MGYNVFLKSLIHNQLFRKRIDRKSHVGWPLVTANGLQAALFQFGNPPTICRRRKYRTLRFEPAL
jgi:hypothetical protein